MTLKGFKLRLKRWDKTPKRIRRVGTQDQVSIWFEEGEIRASSHTGNFRIEGNYLMHYSTIEAFRTIDGKIVNNRNCWGRGFAFCSPPDTDYRVSLNAIGFIHGVRFSAELFEVVEADRYHDRDGLRFKYQGIEYLDRESVLYEVQGRRLRPLCHCFSGDCIPVSWKDWQKHLDRVKAAEKGQATKRERYLKELVPISFLEELGFTFKQDRSGRTWSYGARFVTNLNRRSLEEDQIAIPNTFLFGPVLKPAVVGLYERPDLLPLKHVYVFKLVFMSETRPQRVFICGKDEIGQLWAFELPALPYAYSSLEACQRAILGMTKSDILVAQS